MPRSQFFHLREIFKSKKDRKQMKRSWRNKKGREGGGEREGGGSGEGENQTNITKI